MALTNAERQKRHRERLHAKANSPGMMMRDACLKWIDEVKAEWSAQFDYDPDDEARLNVLRAAIESDPDMDATFVHMVNEHMEFRLKRTKAPRPKPAKARRSRPEERS